jgi:hypothetical protein
MFSNRRVVFLSGILVGMLALTALLALASTGITRADDESQVPLAVDLETYYLTATTDSRGYFTTPHGLPQTPAAGRNLKKIVGIIVSVQHKGNLNWHTLEGSNTVDNRFWWTDTTVEGIIAGSAFTESNVQVIVFTREVIG